MQTGGIRLFACTALAAATMTAGLAVPAHATPLAAPVVPKAATKTTSAAPAVAAKVAYLLDTTTGRPLLAKQATKRVPIASLTKVMTAYVVLREAGLDDVVKINADDVRHAATNDATSASLRAGERLTVRDLLHGVMLPSGADASHALARVYGPGEAKFVAKMNAAARSLGLTGTRYTNTDGLPKPSGGYSTAQDQAKLAQVALGDPVLLGISSTRRYTVAASKVHRAHTWTNTNKLLGKTSGALGVKTGYTRAAGYCLTFAADRDGHRFVGVLLGDAKSERRFQTANRLLDWAGEQVTGTDTNTGGDGGTLSGDA
ncbi:D-alanyl-D-alanine carboxypeptidase family protein [Streptosporangium saharense]|uniref:D-alanyl-D-alanine carboxypeptidase family protein n=1 Tax=Streptosporangium saharense TaxID=1706840 RepID=UPI0036B9C880